MGREPIVEDRRRFDRFGNPIGDSASAESATAESGGDTEREKRMDEVRAAFREIHEVEGRVAELEGSLYQATRALNVLYDALTPAEQEVALRELGMSPEEVAQIFKPKRRIGFTPGEDDAAPQSAEPHRTGKIGF